MPTGSLIFNDVAFFYESSGEPVFDGLTAQFPQGWTGVIGANGSGKTTLLRLACGDLRAARGRIVTHDRVVYCPQRTDDPPSGLASFVEAADHNAIVLRDRLGVDSEWVSVWPKLSHGERKRAQIAVALWRRPRVLALDEPTNHIDYDARRLLAESLRSFRGVGLLVSHDRDLLDALCSQCLFVAPPGAVMRPGGYSKSVALADADQEQARLAREQAKRDLKRLKDEAGDRRREADRAQHLRSKGRVARKDHDAKQHIGQARYTSKDGQAGRLLRQMTGRLHQAQAKLAAIHATGRQRLGIELQGVGARRNTLFDVPAISLALGAQRCLMAGDLSMKPDDRVALVGPNGSGKSTLVRYIVSHLDLPADKVVYMPQEIDRSTARKIITDVRRLPDARLGGVMTVIDCLGSDPRRVLTTDQPSPGELRKIMLALGIARRPNLIIMDEPTNHLDLPSIECLENALDQVICGLLLVSHDMRFLRRLTWACWQIVPDPEEPSGSSLRVEIDHSPWCMSDTPDPTPR
ncbi:MAG TPA: ATP-binding cassette domain-containing protein [Phycisphaerae bacterium]|nr:ATP-binding cassette domain-containing protein [Phycisphaerae bacterium]